MPYQQRIDGGFGEHGAKRKTFTAKRNAIPGVLESLKAQQDRGDLPILDLPARRDDLKAIEDTAKVLREGFRYVAVLGTGGSTLGGQALCALAGRFAQTAPRLSFLDNIDPDTLTQFLETADLAATAFIVISKSGATVETLTQCLVCMQAVRAAQGEAALAMQFRFITTPGENPLRTMAQRFGIPVLDHDPKVGGRFAILSSVGLLPAAVLQRDIRALRHGMQEVLQSLWTARADSAPAQGAALQAAWMARGLPVSVLMPYADRLAPLGTWVRQIWAESLGKEGKGSLPVNALGTVDQHSQLQLYLDGPKDKAFTLLLPEGAGKGPTLDSGLTGDGALAYLAGHTVGDVMEAHGRATAATLEERGLPVRIIEIDPLDETVLGALIGHFMLETIITAGLLGVNAFDQPAVEDGKVLARKMLAEKKLRTRMLA